MQARIRARQAMFVWSLLHKREDPLVEAARVELQLLAGDKWVSDIAALEDKIGPIKDFISKNSLRRELDDLAVQEILDVKSGHPTMRAASQPAKWFVLQAHVNDSQASRDLCRARSGAMCLGNRFRNGYGELYEACPACERLGRRVELWEGHVVFHCPLVNNLRRQLRVQEYRREAEKRGCLDATTLMRKYLGDDGSDAVDLLRRGAKVRQLIDSWMMEVHE